MFALTWLSYASYYFTRKNLSVVKSRLYDTLHISTTALGTIEALYLASYALGQFVSGAVGDRIGARKLLSIGMSGSALTAFVFGASSAVLPFALAFVANGFLQSTGWSGNVKAMQPFFSSTSRGRVMGLWTTNYQVGGLLATALATFGPEYDETGYYIGTISNIRIRVMNGIPQYYGFVWKPYGPNSQRNPLRVRLPKGSTRLVVTAANDPRNGSPAHPLQYMMLRTRFGVGVGDRTNGTPRYVNNANWADGTPT